MKINWLKVKFLLLMKQWKLIHLTVKNIVLDDQLVKGPITDLISVNLTDFDLERKKSISKFHFSVKFFEIWKKKVVIQNCLLHKDLQFWISTFFHEMFIFRYSLKKYYWKSKTQFFNNKNRIFYFQKCF